MSKAKLGDSPMAKSLREIALSFPEAHEDFPWGHSAFKVKGKAFMFMGDENDVVGFSVKLPSSRFGVLDLPNTKPTGYGLGKSGWVDVSLPSKEKPDLSFIRSLVEESYRAIAPKKLAAQLDGGPAAPAPIAAKKSAKKAAKKATKPTGKAPAKKRATRVATKGAARR